MLPLHAAATWFMVGLIWFVQTVHYPLFGQVGDSSFVRYHRRHSERITRLLAVPALAEVVTAAGLVWARPDAVPLSLVLLGGVLLAAIWIVTALVQVPQHRQLASGAGVDVVPLVRANWIRTLLWTARGGLVVWMISL